MGQRECPLVVDLDGTLRTADTMHRMLMRLLARPRLRAGFSEALAESKAHAKCFLWCEVGLSVNRLPWSNSFVAYLAAERRRRRPVWLATGAAQGLAEAVASTRLTAWSRTPPHQRRSSRGLTTAAIAAHADTEPCCAWWDGIGASDPGATAAAG